MRSTLGTSEHNAGASICFYAASKNVSEELAMITPRHFFRLKKKKILQVVYAKHTFKHLQTTRTKSSPSVLSFYS